MYVQQAGHKLRKLFVPLVPIPLRPSAGIKGVYHNNWHESTCLCKGSWFCLQFPTWAPSTSEGTRHVNGIHTWRKYHTHKENLTKKLANSYSWIVFAKINQDCPRAGLKKKITLKRNPNRGATRPLSHIAFTSFHKGNGTGAQSDPGTLLQHAIDFTLGRIICNCVPWYCNT